MVFTSLIIALCLLIACSAFFSGSETALFSLSSMRVKAFAKDVSTRRRIVARLLKDPRELLVTLLIFNVAVNIGIQNVASSIFGNYSSWWLNVGVPLGLTLLFGEALPKAISISNNTKVATRVSPMIIFLKWLIGPLRVALSALGSFFSRLFFFFLRKEAEISTMELKHALKTSKERGLISQDEAKLIRGSLKVEEMVVKELMRPRQEILFYSVKDPIEKLEQIFIDEECSRVPIVDGELDQIIGLFTSDQFFLHRNHIHSGEEVKRFIKKPCFVPETVSVKNLLATLQDLKETLALVVDEYGLISGLVTKEDIFEIIIGQIEDKRDDKPLFTRQGDGVIICSGKLEIQMIEELFDIQLESTSNMVTVGGWLTEKMGEIPKSGSKFVTENLLFHILAANPTRATRIYIRQLSPIKKKSANEREG